MYICMYPTFFYLYILYIPVTSWIANEPHIS